MGKPTPSQVKLTPMKHVKDTELRDCTLGVIGIHEGPVDLCHSADEAPVTRGWGRNPAGKHREVILSIGDWDVRLR